MAAASKILVIALGNPYRSDDGAGLALLKRLQESAAGLYECLVHSGDPADLMELWCGRCVILLDAAHSQQEPAGRIYILKPMVELCLDLGRSVSSHALGLQEAIELGRLLGKTPDKLIVLAINGENFSQGLSLSPPVEASLERALPMLTSILAKERGLYA